MGENKELFRMNLSELTEMFGCKSYREFIENSINTLLVEEQSTDEDKKRYSISMFSVTCDLVTQEKSTPVKLLS